MIITDGNGRPFAPIDPPEPDAPIEEKIAYLRAVAARNDAIAACANEAFARQFNRSLRKGK